jgi:hypothetical protein
MKALTAMRQPTAITARATIWLPPRNARYGFVKLRSAKSKLFKTFLSLRLES